MTAMDNEFSRIIFAVLFLAGKSGVSMTALECVSLRREDISGVSLPSSPQNYIISYRRFIFLIHSFCPFLIFWWWSQFSVLNVLLW